MEFETLALEDEGADAVLEEVSAQSATVDLIERTWAFATVLVAARGMLAVDGRVDLHLGVADRPVSMFDVQEISLARAAAATFAACPERDLDLDLYLAASTTPHHPHPQPLTSQLERLPALHPR